MSRLERVLADCEQSGVVTEMNNFLFIIKFVQNLSLSALLSSLAASVGSAGQMEGRGEFVRKKRSKVEKKMVDNLA